MVNDSGHPRIVWKIIYPFVAFFHPDEAVLECVLSKKILKAR
jgi:hypothetical protein